MLRVLLVDDHELVRDALKSHLVRNPQVGDIAEAGTAEDALRIFQAEPSQLVILDIDLPGGSAFEVASQMLRLRPECGIIFLTGYEYDTYIEQALEIGAKGYVLKGDGIQVLHTAIREVMEGRLFFSESICRRLDFKGGLPRLVAPRSEAMARLTRRERELLAHIGRGASLKEAAGRMQISYKTADNQKTSLMKKLDIHDRVELARFAIREGLISA